MTDQGLRKRVARGAFWVSIDTWSGQLAQVATFLLLSRLLGPDTYGVMGLAFIVTVAGEVLISSGSWDDAIARGGPLGARHESSIFWFLVALGVVLAAAVTLLARPAARFFDTPILASLLPWLALTLPMSALSVVPRARLRRDLDFATLALRTLASQLVSGSAGVVLALSGAGIWSLVVVQILQPLVDTVVILTVTRWRPSLDFSAAALRDVLPFVGHGLAARLVALSDALAQRSIVGLALGTVALGLFTFANKILELTLQAITRPMARLLLPSAAQLRADPVRLAALVSGAAQLAGLVVFPVAAGMAMTAPDLLQVAVGPAWSGAVPLLQGLMVVAAIAPFSQIASSLNLLGGGARREAILAAGSGLLAGLLMLVLGRHGLAGVALALVSRTALMLPLRYWSTWSFTGLDLTRLCRPALPPLGAALCMLLFLAALRLLLPAELAPLPRLVAQIGIGILTYAAAVCLFARPAMRTAIRFLRSLGAQGAGGRTGGRGDNAPAVP